MVHVNGKWCKHKGCSKRQTFNRVGEVGGLFCAEHKLKGMV